MPTLLKAMRDRRVCKEHLPLDARPVLHLVVGQAPGALVHASGVPWDDASVEGLRAWLGNVKESGQRCGKGLANQRKRRVVDTAAVISN